MKREFGDDFWENPEVVERFAARAPDQRLLTLLDDYDDPAATCVLHTAQSWPEWERAVAETARVLRPGGRLLLSQFTPETDLTGAGVHPVAGERHLYEGLHGGPAIPLAPATLDAELHRFDLQPELPTSIGRTSTGAIRRVSANGLYRKRT